jgi:hypothetical protein
VFLDFPYVAIEEIKHLDRTEENEIRLSQTLRMGPGAVTISYYGPATVASAKARRAFMCILPMRTLKEGAPNHKKTMER